MQTTPDPLLSVESATAKRSAVASAGVMRPYMPGVRSAFGVLLILTGLMSVLILRWGVSSTTSSPLVTAIAATPSPTPLPTPASVAHAWGANAAMLTLSTQLDASHVFAATGVMPDGRSLLGNEIALDASGTPKTATPGLLDLATRGFTSLGLPAASFDAAPACCASDGRYVIASVEATPGAACSPCDTRYWVYDVVTGKLRLALTGAMSPGNAHVWVSHGKLLAQTSPIGLHVQDLTTGVTTELTVHSGTPTVLAFAWPWLVYADPFAGTHLVNVATGATGATGSDTTLAALHGATSAALDGSTLIAGLPESATGASGAANDLVLLALTGATGASGTTPSLVRLGTFPDPTARVLAASDRVIVFASGQPLVWDRATNHLVRLTDDSTLSVTTALAGDYLVVISAPAGGAPGTPQSVSLYDTALLLVANAQP